MRLLIITQKVDINDDVLGFFHRWLIEFAKHYEFITVIALQVGEYDLPENVKVLSLGKEKYLQDRTLQSAARFYLARVQYIFNFYKYIWSERKNYDAVFVHMNPEYIILAGIWWRLLRKKIFLWYNHTYGTINARIAGVISHKTFHTSPFAFTARFKNAVKMPAGIDIDVFKKYESVKTIPNSILYIGRISPVKNIDILLKAVEILDGRGVKLVVDIYGSAPERDRKYYEYLRKDFKDIEDKKIINFCGSISNRKAPEVYNKHKISVNLTPKGNFDKTILEAMACETFVLVSSRAFENLLPKEFLFEEYNPDDLAYKIEKIFNISTEQKNKYEKNIREEVIRKHNLYTLAVKLAQLIK